MNDLLVTAGIPALLCVGLAALVRSLRGSPTRVFGYNPARSRTTMRSVRGANAAAVLAVAQLAQLAADLAARSGSADSAPDAVAFLVVGFVVVGVVTIVARGTGGQALVAIVGVVAGLLATYLDHGAAGVVFLLVVTLAALWLLGFVRGFAG